MKPISRGVTTMFEAKVLALQPKKNLFFGGDEEMSRPAGQAKACLILHFLIFKNQS